jgi:uroporphyrinogen decarboxylase
MRALLLDALRCSNLGPPPVWLMRQAGRYMPQYRALRERYSLWELFHNPELAARITLLPIDLLDVDAAIIFSDILVIAECLGLQIAFPDTGGPRVVPNIATKEQIDALPLSEVKETLSYVLTAMRSLKNTLQVPLKGFCGGPFTIATYLMNSTSKDQFAKIKHWIAEDPASVHRLLAKITTVTIDYLQEQIVAGAAAVQIFDSWANILNPEQFHVFCLPYLARILQAVGPLAPAIVFCRDSSLRFKELAALKPAAISLDAHYPMAELRARIPSFIAVQGNIAPELLKRPLPDIRAAVQELMQSMQGEKGFIVNLGHGVLPDIPFEHVQHFVTSVKELARSSSDKS